MSAAAALRLPSAGLIAALLLAACAAPGPAPVLERPAGKSRSAAAAVTVNPAAPGPGFHVVKKGETLQSIALEFGQDYKDLVAWNNLDNPNLIRVGQVLRVGIPDGSVVVRPVVTASPLQVSPGEIAEGGAGSGAIKSEPRGGKLPYSAETLASLSRGDEKSVATEPAEPKTDAKEGPERIDWGWPASGKVIVPFAEGSSKGIGISGRLGGAVNAAAAGRVLYAGEDLRGYGKLVVLKHNASFLSVYAHNNQILVKEGQMVGKGEKIAELGKSDSDQPKLHFEIRRLGKPVDPAKFLPAR